MNQNLFSKTGTVIDVLALLVNTWMLYLALAGSPAPVSSTTPIPKRQRESYSITITREVVTDTSPSQPNIKN